MGWQGTIAGRLRNTVFAALAIALFGGLSTFTFAGTKAEKDSSTGPGMYSTYTDTHSDFISDELRNTDAIPMEDLLPELLTAIDRLSKYSIPDELPIVHRVPHEKIEELACGGQKCAALAAYRSGEGIYIDAALKPETDIFARSILLHELVHYVQDVSNELASAEPCHRWYRREQEAYAVQKAFLIIIGSPLRVAYSSALGCAQDSG
ncbi:MAG: hypothetical protein JSU95_07220 [Betaproteobacteria bacterium]|nr:MAG: hypothetical protein JSU95_07220 [Betaproteobacteria bacterium]